MSLVLADFRAPNAASALALEGARLAPSAAPAQTAAKLGAAKKILTDFTARHDLPWPQYCDGKRWKNDHALKFGIELVPAMFLLDQQGHIVSTEACGPKPEAALKL